MKKKSPQPDQLGLNFEPSGTQAKPPTGFPKVSKSQVEPTGDASRRQTVKARRPIPLPGCTPTPLMAYLKALGIFRLVAEQADPSATLHWHHEQAVLTTTLDREALLVFFRESYRPSPIFAPWNGGSGFHPEKAIDKAASFVQIWRGTCAPRFSSLCSTIAALDLANGRIDYSAYVKLQREDRKKGSNKHAATVEKAKTRFLNEVRNTAPDLYLDWLDAVAVLVAEGKDFPPLIGTGGNDGRLDFTNNFQQRLTELFDAESGTPQKDTAAALEQSLFVTPAPVCGSAPIGQFAPGAAGGANSGPGFSGNATINAWDYVFMLEGTLLFAAACSRRFDQQTAAARALAYPFCVRATGAGYTADSLSEAKAARAEIWLPIWAEPFDLAQLRLLFNEGRAQISGRPARSGLEFALALGSFGVDRGLDAFYRYSFMVRNGLAYFAVPTDLFVVRRNPDVPLILEVREWMDGLDRAANSTSPPPPNSVPPVLMTLERAILQQTHQPDTPHLQQVLLALGDAERQLNRTLRWSRDTAKVPPVAALSARWRSAADTGAPEYRLAASLASAYLHSGQGADSTYLPFRQFLENVAPRDKERYGRVKWLDQPSRNAVWADGAVVDSLLAVMRRLLLVHGQKARTRWSLISASPAKLSDIEAFLSSDFDDATFERCLWGLILLRWRHRETERPATPEGDTKPAPETSAPEVAEPGRLQQRQRSHRLPPALYGLLKLCFAGHPVRGQEVPIRPDVFHLAAAGDARRASEAAIVRLRGSSLGPLLREPLHSSPGDTRRSAAALLFPIETYAVERLAANLLTGGDPAEAPDAPAETFSELQPTA